MGKMKKAIIWIIVIASLYGFAACGKKQEEQKAPIQEWIVEYPLENMLAYTVAGDGTVYAVHLDITMEEPVYKLQCFDQQGVCKECIFLEEYYLIEALAISPDKSNVYFTAIQDGYGGDLCLFTYSIEEKEGIMECRFPYFYSIKQLVLMENVVYLLGKSEGWQTADAPDKGYSFSGERLISYDLDTGEQKQLGFDFPISMAESGTGMLIVSGYLKGLGYCIMEYDAASDSMQVISQLEEYKFDKFAVCNNGKDIVYDYRGNSRGLVISDIRNLSVEAELYPDGFTIRVPPVCAGGRVYCDSIQPGGLISFPLDAVQQNNEELTVITREYGTLNAPYGCGYFMNRIELSDEKFTLKVLARDKDYDLCMGNTLLGGARNLRENGVFYPLNDVPGIEEYFARCFPYVREAATKEDGSIWMLPVDVNVYGFVVKQEAQKRAGLSVYEGMTWTEYVQMLRGTSEEDRALFDIYANSLTSVFWEQYFAHYQTLETELFAEAYAALAELWKMDFGGEAAGEDFVMMSMAMPVWIKFPDLRQQFGEDAFFTAMPKLNVSDKNFASCVFLAVNPDSARRTEALSYLADLIAYLMQREDLPYFADWQGEGLLDTTMHKVYEEGEIVFAIDSDIYKDGFEELFSGGLSLAEYIRRTEPKLKMYFGE